MPIDEPMSRRRLLQCAALATPALGLPDPAAAQGTTAIGFIYVGPKDDYGYNQAHAQAAAALRRMPGIKIVEEEKVAETADVERTMESMIRLDGTRGKTPGRWQPVRRADLGSE
jgi:basic membrane protein A and related proteins